MKCYKNVFVLNSLKNNYGFFIYIIIYLLFFVCLLLFSCKYYFKLQKEIDEIIEAKNEEFQISEDKDKNVLNTNIQNTLDNDKKEDEKNIRKKSLFNTNKKKKKKRQSSKLIIVSFPPGKKKRIKVPKTKRKKSIGQQSSTSKKSIQPLNANINLILNLNEPKQINLKSKYNNILEYTDNELNSLIYDEAKNLDKRTFFLFYVSLLKKNHLLIFSFYCKNRDYNSQIIKIFLFFFFFSVHLTVNALFFTDDTMHQIYIEEGHFNFIYQIPQIIYSSLISLVITMLIKFLGLSENLILEIKQAKSLEKLKLEVKKNLKSIKIKFILFFIISFILLFVFMFYITCFCGIYVNTQIYLLKDSIISFIVPLIEPFGLYLIPGIFRISALRATNKDKHYLYKFSQLIETIL